MGQMAEPQTSPLPRPPRAAAARCQDGSSALGSCKEWQRGEGWQPAHRRHGAEPEAPGPRTRAPQRLLHKVPCFPHGHQRGARPSPGPRRAPL